MIVSASEIIHLLTCWHMRCRQSSTNAAAPRFSSCHGTDTPFSWCTPAIACTDWLWRRRDPNMSWIGPNNNCISQLCQDEEKTHTHTEQNAYINQPSLVTRSQVVQNGGVVQVGQVGHIVALLVLRRIHLLYGTLFHSDSLAVIVIITMEQI